MMDKLDKAQQRKLAIGILVAVVTLFLTVTAGPIWVANASRQAALDQASERLQRYEQIAARDAELLPQYESLLQRQKASGNHLRSDTAALAGAELQRRVTEISGANGARVLSSQILPTASEEGFLRVSLKVRLNGTLPAILQSLYELETDDVYMFVNNVAMNDPRAGRSQFKVEIRPMSADFDLIAYMPEES
jgi:sensor c-di-GMP phosphodiesterase-like protein